MYGDWDDFLAGPLAYGQWQGETYAVPQVTDALALLYNVRMLEEAGVEPPTTMDEFVAAGETLQTELGLENAFYMRGDAYWLQPYLWAFGGGLLEVNEEGQVTEILVNNEGSVAGLEYLLNDVLGTIAPQDVDFPNDYVNAMTAFKEGEVAMIFNGPWSPPTCSPAPSSPTRRTSASRSSRPARTAPRGRRSAATATCSTRAWTRPSRHARPRSSRYLSNTENQARLATELNLLPTRTSAYEDPCRAESRLIADFQTVIENATARPVIPRAARSTPTSGRTSRRPGPVTRPRSRRSTTPPPRGRPSSQIGWRSRVYIIPGRARAGLGSTNPVGQVGPQETARA